jgi:hypothetical protein
MFNPPTPRRASAFPAGQGPPGGGDGAPLAPGSEVRRACVLAAPGGRRLTQCSAHPQRRVRPGTA